MSDQAVYIRVKRRNQTVCLLCDERDTILHVKKRILAAFSQHCSSDDDLPAKDASSLQLLLPKASETTKGKDDHADVDDNSVAPEYLDDQDKLCDLNIKEDAVLHVVFPVADNEWEAVDVVPTVIQDS